MYILNCKPFHICAHIHILCRSLIECFFFSKARFWIFRTHGKTEFFSSTYLRYTELTPPILIRLQFYLDLSSSDTNIMGCIDWIQRNRPNFQRIKLKNHPGQSFLDNFEYIFCRSSLVIGTWKCYYYSQ